MSPERLNRPWSTHVWIPLGAGLFFVALLVSALVVPQLRLLHSLQALIYVAVVILALRSSAYALGAGFTIAVAWNAIETLGPHLVQAGTLIWWSFLRTGKAEHLETMMVPIGAVGHIILMIACLAAFFHLPRENRKWWKFVAGGVLVLGYFVLIIAIARPR